MRLQDVNISLQDVSVRLLSKLLRGPTLHSDNSCAPVMVFCMWSQNTYVSKISKHYNTQSVLLGYASCCRHV